MTIPLPALGAAVEGLAGINVKILSTCAAGGILLPESVYDRGWGKRKGFLRYREPGKLRWNTIADLYDLGEGDCKDLVAAACALLRYYHDEMAMPHVYETRRARRWHAIVRRANGAFEDPSSILVKMEKEQRR